MHAWEVKGWRLLLNKIMAWHATFHFCFLQHQDMELNSFSLPSTTSWPKSLTKCSPIFLPFVFLNCLRTHIFLFEKSSHFSSANCEGIYLVGGGPNLKESFKDLEEELVDLHALKSFVV